MKIKKITISTVFTLLLSTGLAAQSATQLFREGKEAFADKFFSRSIESFREFIEKYPSDPRVDQADYMIGVSYFYLRQFDRVIKHFEHYEREYPGSAYQKRIHYWRGLGFYGMKDYPSAVRELKAQIENRQELYFFQKSLQLLGYSHEKMENYNEAAQAYEELYKSEGDKALSALALERLGYIALLQKDYEKSLDFFDRLSVEYSSVPQVLKELPFYQGECYYELGRLEESLKKYQTFISLYSDSMNREKALYRLGSLNASLGNMEEAREYMSLLTRDYPDSLYAMDAYLVMVQSNIAAGNMELARDSLNRLLEREKNPVEIQKLQFRMAQTWEKEPKEALTWYLAAARGLEPEISGESLYRAGMIYDEMGQADEAFPLFKGLFDQYETSPCREEAGEWIVQYYEGRENTSSLKNHLERMLTSYPESEKRSLYLYMFGNIAYKEGDNNTALRSYQNILNIESKDKKLVNETRYRVGYIYTLRKEFYRAADYFKAILGEGRKNELYYRTLLSLGICYMNVRENKAAEKQLQKVLDGHSSEWSGDAYFYLGKIQMDEGNYSKAASFYRNAALKSVKKERKIQALYQLGWSFMRLGSFQEAADSFDELWELDKTHDLAADSLYRGGMAYSYLEKWEESLFRYKKALEIIGFFNLREELLYQTAWSCFMLMRFDDALSYLKVLEKEFPGSPLPPDGIFRAAEAFGDKEDFSAALKAYILLYEEYPDNPLAETALFRAQNITTDMKTRLELMGKFFGTYPVSSRGEAMARQLQKLLRSGDLEGVEHKEVKAILKENLTEQERGIILLGLYYSQLDLEGTMEKLKALDAYSGLGNGEVIRIQLYKGICLARTGHPEQASPYFDGVLKSDFKDLAAEAQFWKARLYSEAGEWKKAADEYLRIPYRYPGEAQWVEQALFRAAEAYWFSGDRESYERSAGRLQKEFPESPWIESLKAGRAGTDSKEFSHDDPEFLSPSEDIPMEEKPMEEKTSMESASG